jgi:putative peptide zinc metalloprotease protein
LTFRGGSGAVLCSDSRADLSELAGGSGTRPIRPRARLVLTRGRLLADTATPSRSFDPLSLTVDSQGQKLVSEGSAWYVVGAGEAKVSSGQVRRDGVPLAMTSAPLTCGDGIPVRRPSTTPADEDPTPTPPPVALPPAGPTPTGAGDPERPQQPERVDDRTAPPRTTAGPGGVPTTRPGGPPPPPPPPAPLPPPPPPPPANQPPTISWVDAPGGTLAQQGGPDYCGSGSSTVSVSVAVSDDGGVDNLSVSLDWSGFEVGGSGMSGGATPAGSVGPVNYPGADNGGGSLSVEVSVSDGEFVRRITGSVSVAACEAPPPPPPPGG